MFTTSQRLPSRSACPSQTSSCSQSSVFHVHKRPRICHKTIRCVTADAAVQADKLTKSDLVAYLAAGCKPPSQWRIGTEHEKLGFSLDTSKRITYEQIRELLLKLQDRFGWQPVMEGDYIIGLTMDGQNISLEPGGQFELSGAPLQTLHQTCAEVNNHLYQVKTITDELGVYFLGLGFDPISTHDEVPVMPKQRYGLMRNYMPTRGELGLDMMFRSCTIQVNLDFQSEQDMVEKFRLGLALQPIATALFANSPFKEKKKTGYLSWRSHVWTDTDPDRCGHLPFVFEDGFGFERYVDYALDVPMYFVYRNGTYHNALGQSFRDFMKGQLPVLPGELPTLKDWEAHLTTIFPEVRLKRFLEMRGADGGPFWRICSLPAMWVGLLYDAGAQDEALQLIQGWTNEDIQYLRDQVPVTGLHTPFKGTTVQAIAKNMLDISARGLVARGHDEVSFLHELMETASSGLTLADKLLGQYENEWNGDVTCVLESKRM